MHLAGKSGCADTIEFLIGLNAYDIDDAQNDKGRTALIWATDTTADDSTYFDFGPDEQAVKMLLDHGANCKLKCKEGRTDWAKKTAFGGRKFRSFESEDYDSDDGEDVVEMLSRAMLIVSRGEVSS